MEWEEYISERRLIQQCSHQKEKGPVPYKMLQTKYINAHSFISLVQIFNTVKLQQKEHLLNI
jgi:hypothetical protein